MKSPKFMIKDKDPKNLEHFKKCLTEEIRRVNHIKLKKYGLDDFLTEAKKVKTDTFKNAGSNYEMLSGKFEINKRHLTQNDKNLFKEKLKKLLTFNL